MGGRTVKRAALLEIPESVKGTEQERRKKQAKDFRAVFGAGEARNYYFQTW